MEYIIIRGSSSLVPNGIEKSSIKTGGEVNKRFRRFKTFEAD